MDFSQFLEQHRLDLNPQQKAAVQSVEGATLLLAVPGSGKTTVLVTRIGYMLQVCGICPEQILTMTYTVAAARDMQDRFAALFPELPVERLEFRTINGVCSRIIRIYERSLGRKAFQLMDHGKQRRTLLAELCRRQTQEYVSESMINALETAITYVKNQMLSKEDLANEERVQVEGIEFLPIYQAYCKTLREQRLMDYDDQMVYALQILKQYPQILRQVQQRYQYFCVDEAQDTSKIQHCIIQVLSQGSGNLFMVGDEDQSIYGFRAAYPQALTQFEQNHPNARVLYMEQNYRSTRQIVAAADRFIQQNQNRHPKHMKATRGDGPEIREISLWDRQAQYPYLCKVAASCQTETAVLYRDNDSVLPLIDRLDRAGIPYRSRQVNSAFFTNRVVRDISDIIHLAQNPTAGERFLNVYYKLGAGISKNVAQEAVAASNREGEHLFAYLANHPGSSDWSKRQCKALQTHLEKLCQETADRAVYRIAHFMGYQTYLEEHGIDTSRIELLEALGAEQPSPQRLLDRLEELQSIVEQGPSGERDCPFVVSTIHSSKGLEYERVYLMDVMDGILPGVLPEEGGKEEERDAYEEERRLFYVGMTRAKQELHLFTFRKPEMTSQFAEELFPKQEKARSTKEISKVSVSGISGMLRKAAQPVPDTSNYCPGARVKHKRFGLGTLTFLSGDIASISFDQGMDKKISLATAVRAKQLELV